jgi:hypothetical protein
MFKSLIAKLLKNLPKRDKPLIIELVLDGGLFNGSYLIGSLIFLKELEKNNYVKVTRISGCSVGAAVGLLYVLDKLEYSQKINKLIIKEFKKDYTISIIKHFKCILFDNKTLSKEQSEQLIQKVNNKMYVSYYKKQTNHLFLKKTKNKYKHIDDLFDSILRSCFVPFLIDGNIMYKKKYIDGITPFIFKPKLGRKILYLNLCNFDKLYYMINIKNENSDYHRILTGLLDIHLFFIKNTPTSMCSYVNNWSFIYKIKTQYCKYIFEFCALKLLTYTIYLKSNYELINKSNQTKINIKIIKDLMILFYKYLLDKQIN